MNEEIDPVEKLLASMSPASLNNDLMARLTAARPTAAPMRNAAWSFLARWIAPLGAVAAVALVTVKVLESHNVVTTPVVASVPAKTNSKTMPVIVEDHLLHAREMGVMVGPNQRPYQVMEYQWVESETIVPGANAPKVRLETTRRQIVPVQLEVY